jgi:hypothetical protein
MAGYLAVLVGGLVTAGAALTTWSTLVSRSDRRTFNGLAVGDGRFTLVLGLVLAALGLAGLAHRPFARAEGRLALALGGAVVAFSAADIGAGPPELSSFRRLSGDTVAITSGPGLTLSVVGGVVALLGALLLLRAGRAPDGGGS